MKKTNTLTSIALLCLVNLTFVVPIRAEDGEPPASFDKQEERLKQIETQIESTEQFTKAVEATKNGDNRTALIHIRKAIELRPNDPKFYVLASSFHSQLGEFKEAETYLQQAEEVNPEYYGIYVQRGQNAMRQGNREEAIKHLEIALTKPNMSDRMTAVVKNQLKKLRTDE